MTTREQLQSIMHAYIPSKPSSEKAFLNVLERLIDERIEEVLSRYNLNFREDY